MRGEITIIADLLKANFRQPNEISAYAFGSAICPNKEPNDIDIMILYDNPVVPQKIRHILDDLGYIPIHLIFLTPEEEIETNFIENQHCISIF